MLFSNVLIVSIDACMIEISVLIGLINIYMEYSKSNNKRKKMMRSEKLKSVMS